MLRWWIDHQIRSHAEAGDASAGMLSRMSRRPRPLPPELEGNPFTVAEARSSGVSRRRTRAADLRTPFRGVRVPAGEITLLTACRGRLLALSEGAVISHITAARLHGMPLPPALARARVVHVSVSTGTRAPEGRNTAGHQVALSPTDVDSRHGILGTTPERTFCDLAGMLSLAQLVTVGDYLLRRRVVSRATLAAAVDAYPGRRGNALRHRALELLDERSESPKESELRVLLVEAAFPCPISNARVRDARGRFVARVDLSYPDLKIAIEYEGDHHRDKAQWRADLARRRRLEALGWIYLSVTQDDLTNPSALLADLTAALHNRLAEIGR